MLRRLIQTKVFYNPFYSVSKRASHKPLKVAAAKRYFPSGTTCFGECFLIPCDNWKQYFLHKFTVTQRLGATITLLHSLNQVF